MHCLVMACRRTRDHDPDADSTPSQVELHGIGDGDQLLLWREPGDGVDVLRVLVRPAGEPVDAGTVSDSDSDDDVPLCSPAKSPRSADDAPDASAMTGLMQPMSGAEQLRPLDSSSDGYFRSQKCGSVVTGSNRGFPAALTQASP